MSSNESLHTYDVLVDNKCIMSTNNSNLHGAVSGTGLINGFYFQKFDAPAVAQKVALGSNFKHYRHYDGTLGMTHCVNVCMYALMY